MSEIVINGGNRLNGKMSVQGAKNSVLPVLAATIRRPVQEPGQPCPEDSSSGCPWP